MSERWSVALQYVWPRRLLSRLVLHATRLRFAPLQRWLIRTVVRRYEVDLGEAAEPDPRAYPTFNAFFTRALRPGARPLPEGEPEAVAAPADGAVLQAGAFEGRTLAQAKSFAYSLEALLGGDEEAAAALAGGSYATVYLSPRDYHRVHLPLAGALESVVHLPGDRFSVSPATTRRVRDLFVRNERAVLHFREDGDAGRPFAVVLVGALLVGSIETPWTGPVADLPDPSRPAAGRPSGGPLRRFRPRAPALERGAEIGRFNMGSTVIVLFPPGMVRWRAELEAGARVLCRQAIGERVPPASARG